MVWVGFLRVDNNTVVGLVTLPGRLSLAETFPQQEYLPEMVGMTPASSEKFGEEEATVYLVKSTLHVSA